MSETNEQRVWPWRATSRTGNWCLTCARPLSREDKLDGAYPCHCARCANRFHAGSLPTHPFWTKNRGERAMKDERIEPPLYETTGGPVYRTPMRVMSGSEQYESYWRERAEQAEAALALIAPAPEAITVHLSPEDAKYGALAIGHSLSIGVPKEREESIRRAKAAIESALARGAAADAGEDGGE